MLPYTLTALQQEHFSDVFDLYAPTAVTEDGDGWTEGASYGPDPTHVSVPGLLGPSNELLSPVSGLGQSDYDISDTMDTLMLHLEQPCGAFWCVQLKTPGHPEEGTWFVVQGDSKAYRKPADVAHRRHHMKRSTCPPGVAP
jgi:hypothetical protein